MKKIYFAVQEKYIGLPQPGKKFIPEWYKKLSANSNKEKFRLTPDNKDNATVKRCVPFLDAMLTGYVATLWQDLQVTQINGFAQLNWPTLPAVAAIRDSKHTEGFAPPAGHSGINYSWLSPFVIKTPPGYSMLLTHPLNRFDLPFTTTSGVVDADGLMHQGNIPFFLKEGFEGVIPKGTPIFQILPFKRDGWTSEEDTDLLLEAEKNSFSAMASLSGWYREKVWAKKKFEDGIKK
jgi:hypothetical protein